MGDVAIDVEESGLAEDDALETKFAAVLSWLQSHEGRLRAIGEANFIQRDCVIAATAPFALIAEGLNCLTPQTPPPAAEPAPAPEPEKPDGWVALDNKFDVFVCTNV